MRYDWRVVGFGVTKERPLLACNREDVDGAALRVLAVIPHSDSAPSFAHAHRLIEALRELGANIECFPFQDRSNVASLPGVYKQLRQRILSFRPDILHAHFGTMTSFLGAAASTVPLVITFHGSDVNPATGDGKLRNLVAHTLSQMSTLRARRIICVSEGIKCRLVFRKRVAEIIPVGVDLDKFQPIGLGEARNKLGWRKEGPVALFYAGKDPIGKREDLARASMRRARELVPGIRLEVLRGEVHEDLMPVYYNAADCLIVTSDYEGSPCIVKEAIACNLPVVSVDVGDVRTRLVGVYPSAIVERNPGAIGEAVARIVSGRQRSNGREMAGALCSRKIAARVLEVYERAAVCRR